MADKKGLSPDQKKAIAARKSVRTSANKARRAEKQKKLIAKRATVAGQPKVLRGTARAMRRINSGKTKPQHVEAVIDRLGINRRLVEIKEAA